MTEMPSKVILTISILVITILFITEIYVMGRNGQGLMNKSNAQQDKVKNMYNDSKLTQFDGRTITGSQIIKVVDDYYDGMTLFQIETSSGTVTLPDDDHKDKITCITYIKGIIDISSIYEGTVIYDSTTGAVKALDFKLSSS